MVAKGCKMVAEEKEILVLYNKRENYLDGRCVGW